MNINDVFQLIGSYGFPIVCCCYMMITNNKTLKEMSEVINSNTIATNNLTTLLTAFLNRGGNGNSEG